MLDPKILKTGQSIVLRQNSNNGKWQEFIVDREGQILAVEDVKLFEKSKLESIQPNNYEELKKSYQYLSKTEQSPPPIEINEPLEPLDNNQLEPPEEDIDPEPPEHECERECPTAPCSICGSDAPYDDPNEREYEEEEPEEEKEKPESDCDVKANDSEEKEN